MTHVSLSVCRRLFVGLAGGKLGLSCSKSPRKSSPYQLPGSGVETPSCCQLSEIPPSPLFGGNGYALPPPALKPRKTLVPKLNSLPAKSNAIPIQLFVSSAALPTPFLSLDSSPLGTLLLGALPSPPLKPLNLLLSHSMSEGCSKAAVATSEGVSNPPASLYLSFTKAELGTRSLL